MEANGATRYVFDLDGTLIDGFGDLLDALNHSLGRFDAPAVGMEALRRHIGNGARPLVAGVFAEAGLPEDAVDEGLLLFRASYRARCCVSTTLYPGVAELLTELGPERAALLTNKPRAFAMQILRDLGVRARIGPVVGGDSLPVRKPHPATVRFVARLWDAPLDALALVGDSIVDMKTAHVAGVSAVGVSWGNESADELLEGGAERVIDRPVDLLG